MTPHPLTHQRHLCISITTNTHQHPPSPARPTITPTTTSITTLYASPLPPTPSSIFTPRLHTQHAASSSNYHRTVQLRAAAPQVTAAPGQTRQLCSSIAMSYIPARTEREASHAPGGTYDPSTGLDEVSVRDARRWLLNRQIKERVLLVHEDFQAYLIFLFFVMMTVFYFGDVPGTRSHTVSLYLVLALSHVRSLKPAAS